MKWITIGCGALLSAALAAPGAVLAAPLYNLTVIGGADSVANDINALGQLVGYQKTGAEFHAFFYDGSTVNDLSPVVGAASVAQRLNDSGTIVGRVSNGAFAYAGGASIALPLSGSSQANGLNNAGTIVGATYLPLNGECCSLSAYTYNGAVFTNLGTTPDGYGSYAEAINNAGHVAGTNILDIAFNNEEPFFYSDGVMHNLGSFGAPYGHSWAINNHDQVVGEIGAAYVDSENESPYPRHAFLYDGGVVTDLGVALYGGDSSARDINDRGQIVGNTSTGQGRQAFLYEAGCMVLLDTLLDPTLGWTVQQANGINELGQIAGTACKAGLCYAVRLDLATAVPEPAGVLLLAVGLLALTVARRARHSARSILATGRSVVSRMLAGRRHPVGCVAC